SEFPWIRNHDHSDQKEVSDWLNLEIKDFCDYLSPSRAEIVARNAAVKRLRKIVHDLWPDAELSVFGSFATDLYLPGSDIDMVVLSPSGKYSNKVFLFQLANKFKALKVCKSIEVIAKARVPIIKMVDTETNIHIDISFEKEGGVQAAELINSWIEDIPSLRYLVMVIKQFLSARKMNNVHNGGMGGFSVICIVYSFLKLHPKVASGYIDPSENLGVLLIEFFELYGKHFNYDMVALRMKEGCGYFSKRTNPEMQGKNSFILAIEDPNDSSNNISRGTYNIRFLKKAFAGAYGLLTQRCYDLEDMTYKERIGQSILGAIVKLKGPVRDFIDSTGEIANLA
ncbi:Nucleotidyltransferase, partial [Nadsonia fulvescens var. elongata DSM 6958]